MGAISLPLLASTTSAVAASPRTPTATSWKQVAELKGSGTVAGDEFGGSVAISGTTAVIGAPGVGNKQYPSGRAYVFTKTVTGWKQAAELKGFYTSEGDVFGASVAISGTNILVSSPYGTGSGRATIGGAYVFANAAAGWTQVAELNGSDTFEDDFGGSVAISGTTAIVSQRKGHTGGLATRMYVYTKTAAGWKGTAELKGFDIVANWWFGSVAISGTTIVVGSTNANRAYVFTKRATGWKRVAELKGSDTVAGDDFGSSVAISGTTIVVGALNHDNFGRAYVFTKTATGWTQVAELNGSDIVGAIHEFDQFGESVAISGTTAVVGCSNANRAYVFAKTAAGWVQVAELKGSDTVDHSRTYLGDYFGGSVAISGTTIVVGAEGHARSAGRAYVFEA
jgi:hypothetical protein